MSFGWLFLVLGLFGALFGIAGTVLWIVFLVEVLQKETDENNVKLVWALVIIFTGWIGALIYLLVRRPQRIRQLER